VADFMANGFSLRHWGGDAPCGGNLNSCTAFGPTCLSGAKMLRSAAGECQEARVAPHRTVTGTIGSVPDVVVLGLRDTIR
jgi:hypothetical protein